MLQYFAIIYETFCDIGMHPVIRLYKFKLNFFFFVQVSCFGVNGNIFCFGKSSLTANKHYLTVVEEPSQKKQTNKNSINFTLNLVRGRETSRV